jgi:hypothetical protein
MSPEELREYATTLMFDAARTIELLDIFDLAEEYLTAGEISEPDARIVSDLIREADITVSFPVSITVSWPASVTGEATT